MADGMWRGLNENDSLKAAKLVEKSGLADVLVPSGGFITNNGLFMLRFLLANNLS